MINGFDILKEKYPDFDEDCRTPNGLDLRLGNVYELSDEFLSYGIMENRKDIPVHIKILPESSNYRYQDKDGEWHNNVEGWFLQPNRVYILEVDRQIKISDNCAQIYRPRSTLLRSGVALYTATGDAGYNGHLAFMCINHSARPFFMEVGVRFAQMIDFEVKGASTSYDGDFQEERKEVKLDTWLKNRIQF